jgi:hypothetical protein
VISIWMSGASFRAAVSFVRTQYLPEANSQILSLHDDCRVASSATRPAHSLRSLVAPEP